MVADPALAPDIFNISTFWGQRGPNPPPGIFNILSLLNMLNKLKFSTLDLRKDQTAQHLQNVQIFDMLNMLGGPTRDQNGAPHSVNRLHIWNILNFSVP